MRYPSNLISCTHSGVLGALLVKVASDGGTNSGNLARRAPGIAEATPAKSSSLVFCFFVALAAGFAFAVRARAAGFALGADFAAGAVGFAASANSLLVLAGRLECHCLSFAAAISSIDRPETTDFASSSKMSGSVRRR